MRLAAANHHGAKTPILPIPWPQLQAIGLRPRRGQLSLTVAASGVGKSQLWQNLAARTKVPTLFWSADTDAHDVLIRSCALFTGHTIEQVERNREDPAWREDYDQYLADGRHIDWCFESAITRTGMEERILAFAEVHGEYPHLIVLDNLSNSVEHQADELAEQKEVMIGMQLLARRTDAHIAILAHAKGQYEDGLRPIPQSGVLNNLGKWPSLMVTLHRADDAGRIMGINVVKSRAGKADPGAKHTLQVDVDYSRASVLGWVA